MNKFTVIGLLGVTQQAKSPLPAFGTAATSYPYYPSAPTLDATYISAVTATQGSFLNAMYINSANAVGGLYSCVRTGNLAFPSQNVNKTGGVGSGTATDGLGLSTITAASAGYRAFWQHDLSKASKIVGSSNLAFSFDVGSLALIHSSETANGDIEVCCNQATAPADWTNKICPGGTNAIQASNGAVAITYKDIAAGKRVIIKATQVQGATSATAASTFVVAVVSAQAYWWQWNQDIILQSLYQSSMQATTETTDGTVWCGKFSTAVVTGTDGAWSAYHGLGGKTKCAMQFNADVGGSGPSFSVTASGGSSEMLFGWMDWYNVAGLGSNAAMPTTDKMADLFLGAYTTTGAEVFLNPVGGGGTQFAALSGGTDPMSAWAPAFTYTVNDPMAYWAGSVGMMQWHNSAAGVYSATSVSKIDSAINMFDKTKINDLYNTFNSSKASYDSLKTLYDQAITDENARQADFFKATFDAPIAIPTRPCMPDQPPAWWGPMPKFGDALAATPITWASVVTANATTATLKSYPVSDAGGSITANTWATSKGYLHLDSQVAAAGTSTTLASTGRAFGRLGQGDASMPANASPFAWQSTATATEKPSMMLSLLPNGFANVGLDTATKKITMVLKASTFASNAGFDFPSQPAAASPPTMNNANGAMKIAASLATAAAMVAATL